MPASPLTSTVPPLARGGVARARRERGEQVVALEQIGRHLGVAPSTGNALRSAQPQMPAWVMNFGFMYDSIASLPPSEP